MAYTTLNLAYSEEYVYYILLTYDITLLFWNCLYSFVM